MSSALDLISNRETFAHIWSVAKVYAASQLIPPHLRGKVEDVFLALTMAEQLGENPVVVMQSIYVVSGRAGWTAQYMIARANRSGIFRGRINWRVEGSGDALTVTAYAILADTGEEISISASMAMAKAEGWTKNSKYQSMPEVMLRYRSATLLVRMYAPDVMLGYSTVEELETVEPLAETGGVQVLPKRGKAALGLSPAPALPDHGDLGAVAPEVAHRETVPASGFTPTPEERAAIEAGEREAASK